MGKNAAIVMILAGLILRAKGQAESGLLTFDALQHTACFSAGLPAKLKNDAKAELEKLKTDARGLLNAQVLTAIRDASPAALAFADATVRRLQALDKNVCEAPARPVPAITLIDGPDAQIPVSTASGDAPRQRSNLKPVPNRSSSPTAGASKEQFTLDPAEANFGLILQGRTTETMPLKIVNNGPKEANLRFFPAAGKALVQINPPKCERVAPQGTCSVTVKLLPQEAGPLTQALKIDWDSDGKTGSLSATLKATYVVTGAVDQHVVLSRRLVRFPLVAQHSESTEETITMTNKGPRALDLVDRPRLEGQGFVLTSHDCQKSLKKDEFCTAKLRFQPVGETGPVEGKLIFPWASRDDLNKPYGNDEIVELAANVIERPVATNLKPLPAMISFQDQEVSTTSAPVSIALTNEGSTVTSDIRCKVEVDPSDQSNAKRSRQPRVNRSHQDHTNRSDDEVFRIDPCEGVLKPSEHRDIKVYFKPDFAREIRGFIQVTWKTPGATGILVENKQIIGLRGRGFVKNTIDVSNTGGVSEVPATRLVAGIDLSGASSLDIQERYFLAATLQAPWKMRGSNEDPLDSRFWLYFGPRLISLPEATSAAVQGFNAAAAFLNPVVSGNVSKIGQAIEVSGGPEIAIVKPRRGVPFWTSERNVHARLGISWFASAGFTSPFSASRSPGQFEINRAAADFLKLNVPDGVQDLSKDEEKAKIPEFKGKDALALVSYRSRFLRQYYTGVRMKTWYFSRRACEQIPQGRCEEALFSQFPGTVDVGLGQDESVTRGQLRNWVFKFDVIQPLPFARAFTIFGTINSAIKANSTELPSSVLLKPRTDTLRALGDDKVLVRHLPLRHQDFFRIGIGIDLSQLLKKPAANPLANANNNANTNSN